MPKAEDIRAFIRAELAGHETGSIAIVEEMRRLGLTNVNRTHLADFLRGKKNSLNFDFAKVFADFLSLDVDQLRAIKPLPVPAIRKGARPHLYVAEHMEDKGLDDETMANRMDGIHSDTVAKWRADPSKLADWQVAAILHALDMAEAELSRPPARRKPRAMPRKVRKTG